MSGGLSRGAALLLVALAFGATFAVRALPRSGSSAQPPSKNVTTAGLAARDLRLAGAAAVPALRQPRRPRVRTAKVVQTLATPAPTPVPSVEPVVRSTVDPTVTAQPTAPPAPRYVAPAPPPPRPTPTAAPPSGEFDTSGDGIDPGAP